MAGDGQGGPAPRGRPALPAPLPPIGGYCFLSVKSPVTVAPFLIFMVVATGR